MFLRIPFFLYTGLRQFTRAGYERAAAKFTEEDQKVFKDPSSLKGKTCMVTGANQGLGYQISLELAKRGGKVYMVCRNKQRGETALEKIKKESENRDVHLLLCDVSSIEDVNRLCEEYRQSGKHLHVLVCLF